MKLTRIVAGLLLCIVLDAEAQQTNKQPRIAVLGAGSPDTTGYLVDAFKQGLRQLGYIEGQNVRFESRWAMGKPERLAQLANELVALAPDVIFVGAAVTARAAQQATSTIPIVGVAFDPIAQGLVKNLARPGGNLTGFSHVGIDISPKLLELHRRLTPRVTRVAILLNPDNPGYAATLRSLQSAADALRLSLRVIDARTPVEIEAGFVLIAGEGVTAVIVPTDTFLFSQRQRIADLALKNRVASIHAFRDMAEAGGLMSYGQDLPEQFRQAASYVDKILKGAKPGELPIQQSTKLEFVVNVKTAKALGLTIPPSLLLQADRVIE
jgi:putative ABC transport system substrate-binding protein